MNDSLQGHVAQFIDVSRGIGRAIVERLARDGAAVNYAGQSAAENLVCEIEAAGGTHGAASSFLAARCS